MNDTAFRNPTINTICTFLRSIGIPVRSTTLTTPTFLPGLRIEHGELLMDEDQLTYPGDILHEAGHMAVAAPERRAAIVGDAGADPAEEMMAIAWSYAAVVHLGIDPYIVFHPAGYHGQSLTIVESFQQGNSFGVPVLQWLGMTFDPLQAPQHGVPPFPHMVHWLRPR